MSLAQNACDFQTHSYITGWASATVSSLSNDCKEGDDKCSGGWFYHISERCRVYRSVRTLSFATMAITFVSIMLVTVGCFLACMSSQKQMGGIICGLFLTSGLLCFLLNLIWASVSDAGFKDLGESAYYPYPSLGIAYFLHLYGSVMLIVASGVYGWIIYPVVMNYDEKEVKMNKKIARMEKRAEHRARAQEQQMQVQQQCMVQQMYPQPQPMGNMAMPMQMAPQIQMSGVPGDWKSRRVQWPTWTAPPCRRSRAASCRRISEGVPGRSRCTTFLAAWTGRGRPMGSTSSTGPIAWLRAFLFCFIVV
ncbi:unnamed protein product [Prorocentrum cordatum]|uniref:Transmembrane protein 18 n=1 Tax=Prorocentrum cordatum TaxID=2364126 RepID=A0ABN9SQ37_9DINO|nr:unnamed protein product [Polarella glacialis]